MALIDLLLVEDHDRLRTALGEGLEATGEVRVVHACATGEAALDHCLGRRPPQAALIDVQLAGEMNGIAAAAAIRRELPRLPVVFYSMQDDESYYRAFRKSGILTHYAYVRKSNYLLPVMVLPLLKDAMRGWSFIDPEIASRVEEVRQKDDQDPMALLEPNEQQVARMLAQGLSNAQMAEIMGFKDKRTISRTNGQIYVAWGLADTATDEKIARTRAAIIVREGRLIRWDAAGQAYALEADGNRFPYELTSS
jgi:DNA-binding NarL/FixJ family response regulator